jgi:hypothetical protein
MTHFKKEEEEEKRRRGRGRERGNGLVSNNLFCNLVLEPCIGLRHSSAKVKSTSIIFIISITVAKVTGDSST